MENETFQVGEKVSCYSTAWVSWPFSQNTDLKQKRNWCAYEKIVKDEKKAVLICFFLFQKADFNFYSTAATCVQSFGSNQMQTNFTKS